MKNLVIVVSLFFLSLTITGCSERNGLVIVKDKVLKDFLYKGSSTNISIYFNNQRYEIYVEKYAEYLLFDKTVYKFSCNYDDSLNKKDTCWIFDKDLIIVFSNFISSEDNKPYCDVFKNNGGYLIIMDNTDGPMRKMRREWIDEAREVFDIITKSKYWKN